MGAGPAGLYLALLLKGRDPSHEVSVYERAPAGSAPGWGVVFWEDLLEALRACDPPSARALAAAAFRWRDQVVAVQGQAPVRRPGHGYSIRRQLLLELLCRRAVELGVQVHFGREISDEAQLPGADLVVACDGAGSRLRQRHARHFGTRVVEGRNRYVWLGTTRVFHAFTFGLAPTHAGWVWFHAYGFDEGASTLIVECTPRTWTGLGLDRLGAAQGLALLERLFAAQLEGHRLLCPPHAEGALPWRSFRRVTNARWHAGRLVLAGDAAHTTHFAIGSGTRLALLDAIALEAALHTHAQLPAALEAYARTRQAALRPVQQEAQRSAAWFEHLPRQAHLPPEQLATLLLNRRSRLLPLLPPRLYLALARAPALRALRPGWRAA